MRFIAIISVVAIIAATIIIGLLIQRLKNRQAEQLAHVRGLWALGDSQLVVTRRTLRTIRDLQGDSAFDAQMALDEIDRLKDEYFKNQEGITRS